MKKHPTLVGKVKRHPDGFGFFVPDDTDHPDVYIPKNYMDGVMSNDTVKIQVQPEPGGKRFRGSIEKILERSIERVTGQIHTSNPKTALMIDVGHSWGDNIKIKLRPEDKFEDGDWVVAKIITYPGSAQGFIGQIEKVIGDAQNPFNDTLRILYGHGVPVEFPPQVLAEADKFSEEVEPKDLEGRKDLSELHFITIDGVTAKDFDDAIYVKQTDKGFNLKVGIADVSHYVKPGSAIDEEAYKRGNSTYFPNFVSPMLPEVLSNGLCSLRPNTPRLAMVADMHLSFQGELQASEFYEAVIVSHARVTYGQAQEVIEGVEIPELSHVKDDILRASDLSKILMAKRYKEGSLNLEIAETEVQLDETGMPIDIIKAERIFAHKLIEELMLMANVATAKKLGSKDVAALYRIHEPPREDNLQVLENFMSYFGSKNLGGGKLQSRISRALQEFKGEVQEQVLSILTLRSMSQAKYSPDNVGHFGLGFEDYVHFTSPIRRYPDLIIHRQLKSLVHPDKGYKQSKVGDLDSAGAVLSATEQRSVKAERQLVSIKKARFMEKYLGEEFEGIISSVTKFGVFVVLRQFDVDGLVRLTELGGEDFEFDEERLTLTGKKSGFQYGLGDKLKIVVAATDSDEGRIDFAAEGSYIARTPRLSTPRSKKVRSKKPADRFSSDEGNKSEGQREQRNSKKKSHRKGKNSPGSRAGFGKKKSGKGKKSKSSSGLSLKTSSRGLSKAGSRKSRSKNKSK